MQSELFELYKAGKLRPRIMQTFPMTEFATVLDLVATGRARGKVVLTTKLAG